MLKRPITLVTLATAAIVSAACSDQHSPLPPPATTTSVPMLGGGRLPSVIDLPTATAPTATVTTAKAPTTTTPPTTTESPTATATPQASVTRAG